MRLIRRMIIAAACAATFGAGAARAAGGPDIPRALGGAYLAQSGAATFTIGSGGRVIPRSFLGFSTEFDQLSTYENAGPVFDRVVALLRPQDGSPMLLRIGGKSADHTFWRTFPPKYPRQVIKLTPDWMGKLAALVRRDRMHVMLDLNLAVHSPSLETRFAQSAVAALPRGSLVGLEIGNEPDLYWRQPWLEKSRLPSSSRSTPRHWSVNYSPADYRRDYSEYARTLMARVHGVPIGGPEIISNKAPWLASIQGLGRLDPGFITIHRYASSNCWPKTSPWWPTIPLMLGEGSSAGLANSVQTAVAYAHSRREALRLTEVNSISCGGNRGVANSFATALWAPDALLEMIRAGVDSISWHIRPKQLNAPFEPTPNGIQPLPELYGLAAFNQMLRPGALLMNSSLYSSPGLHLKVWAIRVPGGERVMLLNKGPRPASVTLRLQSWLSHAFLRRLQAPRVGATKGVSFGGQRIGTDARWHGRLVAPRVAGGNGVFRVTIPGYSGGLLSAWRP